MKSIYLFIITSLFAVVSGGCLRQYDDELKMVVIKNSDTVWIMNTDGSDMKAITSTATDGICTEASWSSDCETIVYIKDSLDLCVMNSDGGDKKILYTGGSTIINPAFSPDGRRIAFGESTYLYEYNIETGTKTLLHTATGVIFFISVSCDGKISLLHGAGWDAYRPESGWTSYGASSNWGATYSPDGSYIAYGYNSTSLYLVTAGTAALSGTGTLILSIASNGYPAWDPSGEYIYYQNNGIWRVRPDGTGNECVVSDTAFTNPQIQGKTR